MLALRIPCFGASYPKGARVPVKNHYSEEFSGISLINLWYFVHNFGTKNARMSIKPSKDSYYRLESNKTLRHEIGSFGRLPGEDDVIRR